MERVGKVLVDLIELAVGIFIADFIYELVRERQSPIPPPAPPPPLSDLYTELEWFREDIDRIADAWAKLDKGAMTTALAALEAAIPVFRARIMMDPTFPDRKSEDIVPKSGSSRIQDSPTPKDSP